MPAVLSMAVHGSDGGSGADPNRVTGFTKAAFTVKRDDKSVQVELPYVASVYALAKARRTRSDQNAVDDFRPGGAGRFVDHLQQ